MKRTSMLLIAVVAALGLLLAACGNDDDSGDTAAADDASSSEDGAGSSVDEATSDELEMWQTDLNAVGCYAGAVDGSLGPNTEAAIRDFQIAKGLTVDGRLGPQTESALTEAVAAGEIVCSSESSGTPAGSSQISVGGSSYSKDFTIGTCSIEPDLSNVYVTGEADGLSIEVDVVEGTGTMAVSGGTESDGITLNGDVGAMTASQDGSFNGSGEFGEPNNAGEAFTISGSCPE